MLKNLGKLLTGFCKQDVKLLFWIVHNLPIKVFINLFNLQQTNDIELVH